MNKQFKIKDRDSAAQFVDRLFAYFDRDVHPPLMVSVERWQEPRNRDQQAKLHAMINDIARHAGCGEEWFKQKFLKENCHGLFPHWPKKKQRNLDGEEVLVPKSESALSKREESEVIEHLYAFGNEWQVEWSEFAQPDII